METIIGKCSLCGGNVLKETGVWSGMNPPSPAHCESCGATEKANVIAMSPAKGNPHLYP